jgi:hypothetical protein
MINKKTYKILIIIVLAAMLLSIFAPLIASKY